MSKLPGSGIDWDKLSDDERKKINLLPAFLYHGVDSEGAVLMRMNQVPRSVAGPLGKSMRRETGTARILSVGEAREFVKNLDSAEWQQACPPRSALSGTQYREVWQQLSGERD